MPSSAPWLAGRGLEPLQVYQRGWEEPALAAGDAFSLPSHPLLSSSRSPPAVAGCEEQPLPDQGSLWPADAAAPEQRLPAPLPPPAVRAQPRAHADHVSAGGMARHQHWGWISCSPTAEHPCHPRLSPSPRLSPMLWLSPPSSVAAVAAPCPHGRECWLGGFFVSIFGNPGRAVPHPQAFGIRDGKFHLWGRYGNEQSWEGGLWRKTPAAGGGLPKHPPCSLDSLHSTQKEPGTLLMPPDGCSIPPPGLWGSVRCARAASPWGPAEILTLPAQGYCQWDLLSNPWLTSSGGA